MDINYRIPENRVTGSNVSTRTMWTNLVIVRIMYRVSVKQGDSRAEFEFCTSLFPSLSKSTRNHLVSIPKNALAFTDNNNNSDKKKKKKNKNQVHKRYVLPKHSKKGRKEGKKHKKAYFFWKKG